MKKENSLTGKFQWMVVTFGMVYMASISGAMASCSEAIEPSGEKIIMQETKPSNKFLGGLSPEEALEYMKATPNLYIIDVREPEWYEGYMQFTGNVHIPRSKLAERYKEIPTDRPVILNCGAGVQAPRAYESLKELNIDVKQLSYIAGSPLFREYNEWISNQNQ